jgi:hypothetical protein
VIRKSWKDYLARLLVVGVTVLPLAGTPLAGLGVARAAIPVPELVSLDSTGNPSVDGGSGGMMSDSGRYIGFNTSHYDNATGISTSSVYVRDRQQATTVEASILPDGTPATDAYIFAFSGDGRHVAFASGHIAIPSGGIGAAIYVRDMDTGVTVLASVDQAGNPIGVGSFTASLSDDGNLLAFYGANIGNYIRNIGAGVTETLPSSGSGRLSGNGRYFVYGDTQVRVYDRQTSTTVVASQTLDGTLGERAPNGVPVISDDGRYVAFATGARNLYAGPRGLILRRDMVTGEFSPANLTNGGYGAISFDDADTSSLAISGDGSVVAFGNSHGGYFCGATLDIGWYAHSFTTNQTSVVNIDGAGNEIYGIPQLRYGTLTTDGGLTAFDSSDPALVNDGVQQVFVNATNGSGTNTSCTTPPSIDQLNLNADPISPSDTTTLTASVNSTGYGVARVEYYVDSDPGFGAGTELVNQGNYVADISGLTAGTHQIHVRVVDNTGLWSTDQMVELHVISPDSAPPVLGQLTWSANPMVVNTATSLTVPVTDDSSGVAGGEYFIGSDPGTGSGTAMSFDGANLTTTLGSGLTPGVYPVSVRAYDNVGQWSDLTTDYLVVYDPLGLGINGKSKALVPSLAAGNVLPGLIAAGQTDKASYGMTVGYKNGSLDPHNDFQLTYTTGSNCKKATASNCHDFQVNATGFTWQTVSGTNSSSGSFQATATVTVDGVVTVNPVRVDVVDGDRLGGGAVDTFVMKVYAVGANPNVDAPIYRASGSVGTGAGVKIH